jgi:tetratricopeptide (TPR) repeat protein
MIYFQWGRQLARSAEAYRTTAARYAAAQQTREAAAHDEVAQTEATQSRSKLELALAALERAQHKLVAAARAAVTEERASELTTVSAEQNGYVLRMLALANAALGPQRYPAALQALAEIVKSTTELRAQLQLAYADALPTIDDAQAQAFRSFREGIERTERSALIFAAYLYYEQGRLDPIERPRLWDQSGEQIKRAMELAPTSPNQWLNLAAQQYQLGKHDEAAAYLKQFIDGALASDSQLLSRAMSEYRRLTGSDIELPEVAR